VPPTAPSLAHRALLPLRLFLGAMLLYAGVDKFLDPTFLHTTGPGSIGQQLAVFAHASPLTPLIDVFALPAPVPVGVAIALAEIAVGLGALTGLLYRASATGGFALSILFWLTASWTTRPAYYGPDLPYAFGWLTLALAGSGDLYTLRSWFERVTGTFDASQAGFAPVSPRRRAFLQVAALGAATIAFGGAVRVLGRSLNAGPEIGMDATPEPSAAAGAAASAAPAAASPSPVAAASAGAGQGAGSSGTALATLSQLKKGHAYRFADPATGDPAVLIRLANDSVVAYDAVCTHQGCTVGFDSASGLLLCPCHGAVFDPTQGAAVLQGPTNTPLTNLPLKVDPATGKITLVG
jgi:thiosulfate dehydrogenase [quinone] large subunit